MPRIVEEKPYGGAIDRAERIGLGPLLTEIREIATGFTLLIEERRDANGGAAVRKLIDKIADVAADRGIAVVRYPRAEVLAVFGRRGAHCKDDIAAAVAKLVPELAPRLPPRRRIWESEHHSMAIFEAAANGLAG